MKLFISVIIIVLLVGCQMDEVLPEGNYNCALETMQSPSNHPKDLQFKLLMDSIVASGVPGIQLSVNYPGQGLWNGASGYADLAAKVEILPCNIIRVGSTVKTFAAVTILLLQEEGKLTIEEPISNYLTSDQIRGLDNAENSTILQLLQHSSGIFNYIQSAQFQTASLNDLARVWNPDELLEYARGKNAYFEPGTDVLYSNTNYILLGMIIEKVTGKPFYKAFEEKIFIPLGMQSTQFAAENPVPDEIVRGYVDFYSKLNIINATDYSGWDYFTADGGLLSNAHDLNIFLQALFNEQLIKPESLVQMLDWQAREESFPDEFVTDYGLGTFKIGTAYGPAYIHSGDAIGYFASMVYFPDQKVSLSYAVNGNYGKIDAFTQSKEAMETIFRKVFE
jgi:D-alanyl-D-alanine carboxypeptidase